MNDIDWKYSINVGDLVRVYDPDHVRQRVDGYPYSTIGLVTDIKAKSPNPESYRVFYILSEGENLWFDEPYWALEVISSFYKKS